MINGLKMFRVDDQPFRISAQSRFPLTSFVADGENKTVTGFSISNSDSEIAMRRILRRRYIFLFPLALLCFSIVNNACAHAQTGCNSGGCCFNGRCYAGYHGPDPLSGGNSSVNRPIVNNGLTQADIHKIQQEQAAAEAQARYNRAVKVEQDAEAKNNADMKAATEARERAYQEFISERDKLAAMLRDDNASSTMTLHEDSGSTAPVLREDSTPVLFTNPPVKSKWGKEPPLPSSVGKALASNIEPSVDNVAANKYIHLAVDFIGEDFAKIAKKEIRKSALSGEMFAEVEMGPYGVTTVIMLNVVELPNFIFNKISGMVTGSIPETEAPSLVFQSANRIYDFKTPVNDAVRKGVLESVKEKVSDSIEGSAKENLATLAAEFLSVKDEAKEGLVNKSTEIEETIMDSYKHIFTSEKAEQ